MIIYLLLLLTCKKKSGYSKLSLEVRVAGRVENGGWKQ